MRDPRLWLGRWIDRLRKSEGLDRRLDDPPRQIHLRAHHRCNHGDMGGDDDEHSVGTGAPFRDDWAVGCIRKHGPLLHSNSMNAMLQHIITGSKGNVALVGAS